MKQDKNTKNITVEMLEICSLNNVNPLPIANEQLVVISDGVFEGSLVEGTRYPSPEHMSGWWLTTEKYNGDVSTLRTEHFYHILEKRPDLVRYMALPYGFRFFQEGYKQNNEDVWFDEKVVEKEENA